MSKLPHGKKIRSSLLTRLSYRFIEYILALKVVNTIFKKHIRFTCYIADCMYRIVNVNKNIYISLLAFIIIIRCDVK